MPHEFLTVHELADLLRIKERKVYDLAASGLIPCNRATGKLLFPESEIRAWITSNQTGAKASRPAVFLGSHDPLLEWALRQSQCGLATFFDGSANGLERFGREEGIAAGLHIPDDAGWNVGSVEGAFAQANAVLIRWARRARGIVTKSKNKNGADDLSAFAGLKVAMRQPASGTAVLFDRLMRENNVPVEHVGPYHSEHDAVLAVLDGEADAAFGLASVAGQYGLAFSSLVEEEFDLLVDRAAYFAQPFQKFLAFCRSDAFAARAEGQTGYTVEGLGEVRWNA